MINEETLTLYYYEDGLTASERLAVTTALGRDGELARRYAKLQGQLEQWRQSDSHKAPQYLVARWHDSIEAAAGAERVASTTAVDRPPLHFLSFAWGAVAMAALALGVGIGVYFSSETAVNVDKLVVSRPIERESSSFRRGLQLHLQESQRQLVSLPGEDGIDRISLLMQIIEQNRMFQRAAKRNNSPKLARVLRAFEPVLTELAAENLTPNEAEMLRMQLTFELNVMQTKLARETSNRTLFNSI
ncbi:MAG: hypothetical protein ACE1ZA_07760 [Pseudomonadales bacterium]